MSIDTCLNQAAISVPYYCALYYPLSLFWTDYKHVKVAAFL